MLDKNKLREKREKEMAESVNVWTSFLDTTDDKKAETKKDVNENKKK
jgi:hypothetical protein